MMWENKFLPGVGNIRDPNSKTMGNTRGPFSPRYGELWWTCLWGILVDL